MVHSSWLSVKTSIPERTDDPNHVDSNVLASNEEMMPQSCEGSSNLSDFFYVMTMTANRKLLTRRHTKPPPYLSDYVVD